MSITAPQPRLAWRLLPAVFAAAGAVVAGSLLIAALRDRPVATIVPRDPAAPVVAPGVAWDVETRAVGSRGRLSAPARARLNRHGKAVGRVAGALADIVTLEPHRIDEGRPMLTKPAAKAIRRALPALPAGATSIVAIRRHGEIGLKAPKFDAAAAQMKLKVRARIGERVVTWRQDMTLWLERTDKAWRVLAFDIEREAGR